MECEFEESLSSESVLKKAQTFLNDVLKFKLENNLQHNVFSGLTEKFINFFEYIHNNQSRDLIIGCIKDRLKSGRSIERYIQSLPNYVKAEQKIIKTEDGKKYRYHYVDIKSFGQYGIQRRHILRTI